jgi:uncharacterized protein
MRPVLPAIVKTLPRAIAWLTLAMAGVSHAQTAVCERAGLNNSDKTVCATPALAALDSRMKKLYATRIATEALLQTQDSWHASRDRCNGNAPCLDSSYRARIAALEAMKAQPPQRQRNTPRVAPVKPIETPAIAPAPAASVAAPVNADVMLNAAAHTSDDAPQAMGMIGMVALVMMLAAIAALALLGFRAYAGRCPSCRKWNTRKLLGKSSRGGVADAEAPPGSSAVRSGELRTYYECAACEYRWAHSQTTR